MPTDFMTSPFFIAASILWSCGAIAVLAGVTALRNAQALKFTTRTLSGLLLLALGSVAGTIAVGIQGYRALTHEELAARIFVRPQGVQRHSATFRFADGRETTYELAGDAIYVDAHILKWRPLANMFGLHTAYELDRVAGRYHASEQERTAVRTVFALGKKRSVDLFELRRRYAWLSPLLDAQYGSGTFVPVTESAEFELRVSTTGLLIREAAVP